MELSQKYLKNPQRILVSKDEIALTEISQLYMLVNPLDKFDVLCHLIDQENIEQAIVFCRTRMGAAKLSEKLRHCGHNTEAIHADLSQARREDILGAFRDHRIQLLVATDVAARGLDIEGVTHILNYDIPFDALMYFHRIGRTGRVGRTGKAITLVACGELSELEKIQALTKTRIDQIEIE